LTLPYEIYRCNQEIVALLTAANGSDFDTASLMLEGYSVSELTQLLVASLGWILANLESSAEMLDITLEEVLMSFGGMFAEAALGEEG
jgi:hypothetical protein